MPQQQDKVKATNDQFVPDAGFCLVVARFEHRFHLAILHVPGHDE